ncbi:MAG TPA: hypothetical protein VIR30_01985, partial [Nocardioides sp.]
LTHLSSASMDQMGRELGLTDVAAANELQQATAQFAIHRDVPSTSVRIHLEALGTHIEGTRFPRATIIRRRGTSRRRAYTTLGIAACVGALLGAGAIVHSTGGAAPQLGSVSAHGAGASESEEKKEQQVEESERHLNVEAMLTSRQVDAVFPAGHRVGAPSTSDNTSGDGLNTACQRSRFADRSGLATLVRTFPVSGSPKAGVVQRVELSANEDAAKKAYAATVQWFTACEEERAQLISAYALNDMADQGTLVMLNTWQRPAQTWTVSVVRSGDLVTTVARRVASRERESVKPFVKLTVEAVTAVCNHPAAGSCPGAKPVARRMPPPSPAGSRGLLEVIDLPPVSGVDKPWVATTPVSAKSNAAATSCDKADFNTKAVKRSLTRSYVIPEARLSSSFGLTETLGEFATPAPAKAFNRSLERRMATCEDKDAAATVTELDRGSDETSSYRIWRVSIEVSETRSVHFEMALVRRDNRVVQLGFVRDGNHEISDEDFRELTLRASARLANLTKD